MKRTAAAVGLVVTLVCSCAATDGAWTFSTTRWFMDGLANASYQGGGSIPLGRPRGDVSDGPLATSSFDAFNDAETLAALLGVLVLAPVAIDIVLLPVTVPRDLIASEW